MRPKTVREVLARGENTGLATHVNIAKDQEPRVSGQVTSELQRLGEAGVRLEKLIAHLEETLSNVLPPLANEEALPTQLTQTEQPLVPLAEHIREYRRSLENACSRLSQVIESIQL